MKARRPGTTPTETQLTNWTKGYKVNFPAVVDPATSFSSVVGVDAYPGQIIIRTKDMKIVTQEAGVAATTFWTMTFQQTIDGTIVLPGDVPPDGGM